FLLSLPWVLPPFWFVSFSCRRGQVLSKPVQRRQRASLMLKIFRHWPAWNLIAGPPRRLCPAVRASAGALRPADRRLLLGPVRTRPPPAAPCRAAGRPAPR